MCCCPTTPPDTNPTETADSMTCISPQDLQEAQAFCGMQKTTWAEAQVCPIAIAKRVCYSPKHVGVAGRVGIAVCVDVAHRQTGWAAVRAAQASRGQLHL